MMAWLLQLKDTPSETITLTQNARGMKAGSWESP
jgi:hypothetical protein